MGIKDFFVRPQAQAKEEEMDTFSNDYEQDISIAIKGKDSIEIMNKLSLRVEELNKMFPGCVILVGEKKERKKL